LSTMLGGVLVVVPCVWVFWGGVLAWEVAEGALAKDGKRGHAYRGWTSRAATKASENHGWVTSCPGAKIENVFSQNTLISSSQEKEVRGDNPVRKSCQFLSPLLLVRYEVLQDVFHFSKVCICSTNFEQKSSPRSPRAITKTGGPQIRGKLHTFSNSAGVIGASRGRGRRTVLGRLSKIRRGPEGGPLYRIDESTTLEKGENREGPRRPRGERAWGQYIFKRQKRRYLS